MSTARTRKDHPVSTPNPVNAPTTNPNPQNGGPKMSTPETPGTPNENITPNGDTPTPTPENVNPNPDSQDSNSGGNDENKSDEPNLNPGKVPQPVYELMRAQIVENVNAHNALVQQIKDSGDRVAITDTLKEKPETTGDDEFVKLAKRRQELSDALENAEKAFAAAAAPFIDAQLKRSGVEEKQAKADEHAKFVKATAQYLAQMNASTDGLPTLTGRSKTSTSGDGRGSGTPKYRNLEVWVDGKRAEQKVKDAKTGKSEFKSNLTFGAMAANVSSTIFREAFVKAQGTDDAAKFQDRVEFEIVDGKDDKVKHSVVVKKAAE